jgi:hypothetical protein
MWKLSTPPDQPEDMGHTPLMMDQPMVKQGCVRCVILYAAGQGIVGYRLLKKRTQMSCCMRYHVDSLSFLKGVDYSWAFTPDFCPLKHFGPVCG